MEEKEKSKKTHAAATVINTMDIKLTNSNGDLITAEGPCTDKEIKSICKSLLHSPKQAIEIKPYKTD